jgi:NAD(P)-dependent dehydrogenase (short-subunit alcohol dehydrogenase family)
MQGGAACPDGGKCLPQAHGFAADWRIPQLSLRIEIRSARRLHKMTNKQKVAFITGANRGIGLETARGLGKQGITVLIGSRDKTKGQAAAAQLRKDGVANVEAVQFDVANPKDHKKIASLIGERFGKLDILVNNAGIAIDGGDFGNPKGFNTTSTVPMEKLRQTFDTNFFSAVALTRTLLPLLKKSSAGRIVNLSSILGSLTLGADPKSPIYGVKPFAYEASKAALNAFTICLAAELRNSTKIKVNSAHPGWVRTDMGGPRATLDVTEGAKTSIELATLPADGPTGGYFHLGKPLPW